MLFLVIIFAGIRGMISAAPETKRDLSQHPVNPYDFFFRVHTSNISTDCH